MRRELLDKFLSKTCATSVSSWRSHGEISRPEAVVKPHILFLGFLDPGGCATKVGMKIALIGAQGVGKTTVAKRLKEVFSGAYIVKETVRECPYPCDKEADFKTEWWVLSHSILEEREAEEAKYPLVIADRCLLDISVYTKLIEETGDGRISSRKRKLIDDVISRWLEESPYDLMFFIKVDEAIWSKRDIDDGFRSTDPAWYNILTQQFEHALNFHKVASKTRLEFVTNNGRIEDTLEVIVSKINAFRAQR